MNDEMLAALQQPFHESSLEVKEVSGKRFTYVAQHAVTRRLITVTKGEYSFTIVNDQIIPYSDTTARDGTTTVRRWLHLVHARITIGDHHWDGHGVAIVQENSGEDMWKAAESDAFKKACTRIGVALDLYGPDMEAEIALDTYQPDDYAVASIDQRTYIRALWKQSGMVLRDKKGRVHTDDQQLETVLQNTYHGRGILQLSVADATDAISRLQARAGVETLDEADGDD